MDLGIRDKVALVAAASRGLGKAVAHRLAAEGAAVAICSRSADAINEAAADLSHRTGARVEAFVCDVTDAGDLDRLLPAVVDAFGGVDILVANAGGPPAGMAADFSVDDYRRAAELNLFSTIALVYRALPIMTARGWGRIIAITSIAAREPIENLILSNTARAGVLGFMKTLSGQVAKQGITVNSVCPGFTDTERVQELARAHESAGRGSVESFYRAISTTIPTGRMATPDELAATVAFLASQAAASINGIAMPVDGGMSKALF